MKNITQTHCHTQSFAQTGAALFTALVFLVIITLLSLSSMRTSTMELRMASNDQEHTRAIQIAQAAVDTVLVGNNFLVTSVGSTTCFNVGGCDTNNDLTTAPFSANYHKVEITLQSIGSFKCRSCASSGSLFQGAAFDIDSNYNETAVGGGRANVVQGLVVLAPDSGT
ncbi:MAG: hypothetical protein KAJ19_08135 [Gammaproteobacteria bacterium]|nr:hypothetical protein [Gammaproteobacteria bacterium]